MSSCCTSRANTACACGRPRSSIATTTSRVPCVSPAMRRPWYGTSRASAGTTGGGATPSARRLVVNADDFGLSPGVNDGILEAHAAGVVSSVSVLVNAPGWEDAVAALRGGGAALGAGLHLNLTAGESLCSGRSLVHPRTGRFHGHAHRWPSSRARLARRVGARRGRGPRARRPVRARAGRAGDGEGLGQALDDWCGVARGGARRRGAAPCRPLPRHRASGRPPVPEPAACADRSASAPAGGHGAHGPPGLSRWDVGRVGRLRGAARRRAGGAHLVSGSGAAPAGGRVSDPFRCRVSGAPSAATPTAPPASRSRRRGRECL
ncbi:MAG: hypothetical protein DMD73_06885 [Gemmatimonadetes bacterium]|nr:MAG: hypothetical protein DMD73_06885 [Gemmatimonadota bacterium]